MKDFPVKPTSIPHLIRQLQKCSTHKQVSDQELLHRYTHEGDQEAFEQLVERYSRLVWGASRRWLTDEHVCEDVFQATFLVFARRAKEINAMKPLTSWLYAVASRIASKTRAKLLWKSTSELEDTPSKQDVLSETTNREFCLVFEQEMQRLPEKFRLPILLCCVEGYSRDEVAEILHCSLGVVKSRLERGRKALYEQLRNRGIELSAVLLTVNLTTSTIRAAIVRETVHHLHQPISDGIKELVRLGTGSQALSNLTIPFSILLAGILTFCGFALAGGMPENPQAIEQAQNKPMEPKEEVKQTRVDRFGDALPPNAIARFGTVRFRQGFSNQRVVYARDGKTIAIGGCGRSLGVWDVETGKELFQCFHLQDTQPSAVAFSPDGKLLIEGDFPHVNVWDAKTGKLIRKLEGHSQCARAATFSPNGKILATGGHDQTIHLWDPVTGNSLLKLEGHTDSVLALAFSWDGKQLASAGSDKTVRIWNPETGHEMARLGGAEDYLTSLVFTKDNKHLIVAGAESIIRVWDLTKNEVSTILGDAKTNPVTQEVSLSPDGKILATPSNDGRVVLWDTKTWKEIRSWKAGSYRVSSLDFAPNGKSLATSSSWHSGIRFWDVETGKEKREEDVHSGWITALFIDPDGKWLKSWSRDGQLIRWDIANTKSQVQSNHDSLPFFNAFAPDGKSLAVYSVGKKRHLRIVDAETGKDRVEPLAVEDWLWRSAFSPNGKVLFLAGQEGALGLWHWQTEKEPRFLDAPKMLFMGGCFTPDGKQMISGAYTEVFPATDETLILWDVETGKRIRSIWKVPVGVSSVSISPDGTKLVVSNWDKPLLYLIDFQTGEVLKEMKSSARGVLETIWSPDSRFVVAGGSERDSAICLFEASTGEQIYVFRGHHSGIGPIRFSIDGQSIFSAAGDATILQWDITGRKGNKSKLVDPKDWELLSMEAKKAYPIIWDWIDSPKEALEVLKKQVSPAKPIDVKRIHQWIQALDAETFAEREKATLALKEFGPSAEKFIREALENEKRVDVEKRLQSILTTYKASSEFLLPQRVVFILDKMNHPEAKELLQSLAKGWEESFWTKEAKRVLERQKE
jgi:RNA polymerase sigma factor (sigma-70 family)